MSSELCNQRLRNCAAGSCTIATILLMSGKW